MQLCINNLTFLASLLLSVSHASAKIPYDIIQMSGHFSLSARQHMLAQNGKSTLLTTTHRSTSILRAWHEPSDTAPASELPGQNKDESEPMYLLTPMQEKLCNPLYPFFFYRPHQNVSHNTSLIGLITAPTSNLGFQHKKPQHFVPSYLPIRGNGFDTKKCVIWLGLNNFDFLFSIILLFQDKEVKQSGISDVQKLLTGVYKAL